MFSRKSCTKCGNKVNNQFEFCPHCGKQLERRQDSQDYGLLGKDDSLPGERKKRDPLDDLKLPLGFNTIFNTLVKSLDKQFKEMNKEMLKEQEKLRKNPNAKTNAISISISSGNDGVPKISIKSNGNPQALQERKRQEDLQNKLKESSKSFNTKKLKQMAALPKTEPQTSVRRFSDKIIYEIQLPGVESLEDILINQLENSIEIKAIGKETAYAKILPIGLPLVNHRFSKGKLVLELVEKN